MNVPKTIMLPNPDDIRNIEDARTVIRRLIEVVEELHRQIYDDIKALQP